jgi:tRNA(Ile)-lysidine synthase
MLNQIRSFIQKQNMLELSDRVVVGVSGGADSMCLLNVLMQLQHEYQLSLFVVHVNHQIRGAESDAEEAYVREFCEAHKIPISSFLVPVLEMAKNSGKSVEEVGRNVRYELFEQEAQKHHCHKIAIAHNMNDNAETVLFHLFRGSMVQGASGIRAMRGKIIRPLLETKRETIEVWLKDQRITYYTDSSNLSLDYSRNKIRNLILPIASQDINTKSIEHLSQFANQMEQIAEYLRKVTKELFLRIAQFDEGKLMLDIKELKAQDYLLAQSVMKMAIEQVSLVNKDIEAVHVNDALGLMDKQSGKEIHLPNHIIVKRGYTTLILARIENRKDEEIRTYVPQIPGEWYCEESTNRLRFELIDKKLLDDIPKNSYTKWFDYDKIRDTVVIRTKQQGDFLQINQNGGRKTLKSLFIDEKIPKDKREKMYLVTAGSHVLWVPGIRTSEAFLVDEQTKQILSITLENEENR